MHNSVPKQFIELSGKPIIMHTIEAFYKVLPESEIIVVLPEAYFNFWEQLIKKYRFNISHILQKGGDTRFESVKNALFLIKEEGLVAVHDAVRPFVSKGVIEMAFKTAQKLGIAIPVVSVKDSIRIVTKTENRTQKREEVQAVQTPQCFKTGILLEAYSQNYNMMFTDDASVVEAMGFKINLIDGNDENIKITTPIDLLVAESIMKLEKRDK